MRKFLSIILLQCLSFFCFSQQPSLVKDIAVGSLGSGSTGWTYPNKMAVVNGKVLFWANDGAHGTELWTTDGTPEGTSLVKDIKEGSASPVVYSFYKKTDIGVYFGITEGSIRQIWYTDGSPQNTKLLLEEGEFIKFSNFFIDNNCMALNNNLYMLGYKYNNDGFYACIYKFWPDFDPQVYYIAEQKDASIAEIAEFQGNIIVTGNLLNTVIFPSPLLEEGIWDLSGSGQFPIQIDDGYFNDLTNVNNKFLAFTDNSGVLRYINNISNVVAGSLSQTSGDILNVGTHKGGIVAGDRLFYYGNDGGLWVTDGTVGGTIRANLEFTNFEYLGTDNTYAVFQVYTATGNRLIKWDGATIDVQDYSTNTALINENPERTFPYNQNRQVFITAGGVYIRMGDDLHTYKLVGFNASGIQFNWLSQYFDYNVMFNSYLLGYALNQRTEIGFEPYRLLLSSKLWTGNISTDWHHAANWSPEGVPTCTDDIIIPQTPSGNYPIVNADAACKSLDINYGSVIINSGRKLTYFGVLSAYGGLSGVAVAGASTTYYADADGDGHGDASKSTQACSAPTGFVTSSDDCNDGDNTIYTGALELCDLKDNDCDGQTDEGCTPTGTNPIISINNIEVTEGDVAVLTVTLSKASSQALKINYATKDVSATSKGKVRDYLAAKGNLTIPAGELIGQINITTLTDVLNDGGETFNVQLSLSRGVPATLSGTGVGTVTLLNGPSIASEVTLTKVAQADELTVVPLSVEALPNPSRGHFSIIIHGNSNQPLVTKVIDNLGRVIETKNNVVANSVLSFGSKYQPGIYFVEVLQGNERKLVKLVKL